MRVSTCNQSGLADKYSVSNKTPYCQRYGHSVRPAVAGSKYSDPALYSGWRVVSPAWSADRAEPASIDDRRKPTS